ncbi:tetratricopeptide repeat protein [Rubripirellula obstinata]|nr:hypothetical protein [Rubripirellula obstinata]
MISVSLALTSGCRVAAPMHVWTPPEMESLVGKRVGISDVVGPEEIAGPIRQKMLSMNPDDSGRGLVAIDTKKLQSPQAIQLVSAAIDPKTGQSMSESPGLPTNELPTSDLATNAIARQAGLDYVLRGRIEGRNHQSKVNNQELNELGLVPFDPHQAIAVSWKLYSVKDNRPIGGKPVVIDGVTAAKRYPDLTAVADPNDALLSAVVRESYRLVSPSTRQQTVQLATPYVAPGSRATRQANDLAIAGRWGEAEIIWQEVVDRYPTQSAALHNLALAAAAGQDFSRAKTLARKAIRRFPVPLHKNTLAWIEKRQRDYHRAFNLPDPPEGWFVSRDQSAGPSQPVIKVR